MKKIEFGFSNDLKLTGSWEGMGIEPGLLLNEADYYGAFQYDGDSYIVIKIENDPYGRYPDLVGNFIVRDAFLDIYADGSTFLYLDQEQSLNAQKFEIFLNNNTYKNKIIDMNDILYICNGVSQANRLFKMLELDEKIISTSINHEVFVERNEAIKNCRYSISEMQINLANNQLFGR